MAQPIGIVQVGERRPRWISAARLAAILKQLRDPLEQTHGANAMRALSRSTQVALLMGRDTVLENRDLTTEDQALGNASLAPISRERLFAANG